MQKDWTAKHAHANQNGNLLRCDDRFEISSSVSQDRTVRLLLLLISIQIHVIAFSLIFKYFARRSMFADVRMIDVNRQQTLTWRRCNEANTGV